MVFPFLETNIKLRDGGDIFFLNSPYDFMFAKLLIARHLLSLEIYEVWKGERNQSFLLLGTPVSGQTFLFVLELDKS